MPQLRPKTAKLNILKKKLKVTQSLPTLCDSMDCTVPGILPARILEWVAFPFSRGSSQPRDGTQVLPHCRRILYQLSHQGRLCSKKKNTKRKRRPVEKPRLTSHADAHDGRHGAYDDRQERQEHDQVAAEQGAPRAAQLPSVHEVQRQDASPPGETRAGSETEPRELLCKTHQRKVKGVSVFPNKVRFTLESYLVKNLPAMQETRVQFLGANDPLEKEMATHSSILAWRTPWTEEPGSYSPWGHKSQTQLTD